MASSDVKKRGMKKILHLRSSGGLLGAENVLLEIARHSHRFGYQSIVGGVRDIRDPVPDLVSIAFENGLQAVEFPCSKRIDLNCARAIRKFVAEKNIDLLHCHGYKEDIYAILARVRVPKIATNHLWKTNTLLLHAYRMIDALVLRQFNCVAGVSGEIVKQMKRLGIKNPVKIQNGIDINRFNVDPPVEGLAETLGVSSHVPVFAMISSLTSEKNHALVLDVLAALKNKNVQLLIVGEGPLLGELKKRVARLCLTEKVIFAGRRSNIREILSIVDVFMLPSLKEGLPMALLEAMACGKAVISSRVGEIENVIEHGFNGVIVEPGDAFTLTQAMEKFMKQRDLIKKFGYEARKTVEKYFSSQTMTRKYCHLYDRVLKQERVS